MGFGLFHVFEHLQSEREGWGVERDGDGLTEGDLKGDRERNRKQDQNAWRERGRQTHQGEKQEAEKNTNIESLRGSRSPEEQDRKEGGNRENRQMQKRSIGVDARTSGWRGEERRKEGKCEQVIPPPWLPESCATCSLTSPEC